MSGYMPGQALLKATLLTCESLERGSVTEGDVRVLDSGIINSCVLFPGGIPEYDTAGLRREQIWNCIADLFTKFIDDSSYSAFGTLRDAVIATLDAGAGLSASYFVTSIVSDGDPIELYDKQGGGPFFITQRLRITIQENM
jgi:hypothetical protein